PGTVLTNRILDTVNAEVHTADPALDAALAAHQAIPARLPLSQVNPGQQVLETETKLIDHAIRIAALNTAPSASPRSTPRHPHRRVQHRAVPCACDRHPHRLH